MEERYLPDTVLYHVHANVVVWPTRFISADWDDYLKSTRKIFQTHWCDNGRLQNPDQVVKYVLKQGCLTGASDDEIAWLYKETQRLKISQPLGAFAKFMAELENAGEKIVRVKGAREGKLNKVRKATRLDHAKCEAPERTPAESPPRQKTSLAPTNIILGVSLPQRRFTPWAEPLILVQRYRPNATSDGDIKRLEEIKAEMQCARMRWDKNGAPPPGQALRIAALHLPKPIVEPPGLKGASSSTIPEAYNVHFSGPTVPLQESPADAKPGQTEALVPPEHPPADAVRRKQADPLVSPEKGLVGAIRARIASVGRGLGRFKNALRRRWKAS
jgi:hypothetical protein